MRGKKAGLSVGFGFWMTVTLSFFWMYVVIYLFFFLQQLTPYKSDVIFLLVNTVCSL